MFSFLGHRVIAEVSLKAPEEPLGELDEDDLAPTRLEFLLPLLKEINLTQRSYTTCVRRLRHWFKMILVKRLLEMASATFDLLRKSADAFNDSNAPLFPLLVQISLQNSQAQQEWVQQRRKRLEEQLNSNPGGFSIEKRKYYDALRGMESMLWLLSGIWIPGLIPEGCPTGYVCYRLSQLDQDEYMSKFDGHHRHGGSNREATNHTPSDSALMMFLMCLYLKVPNWDMRLFFQSPESPSNGPLVFMNIDPLADPRYSAFLTSVPSRRWTGSNGFILRHRHWTPSVSESIITLLLDGKLRANFGGLNGFFEAMAVYLAYHRLKFGKVGGVDFGSLTELDWVFSEQSLDRNR